MDIAKAFADLLAGIGSAGPFAIVTALLVAHLVLDVLILRASLREANPLLVPGWIFEAKARDAATASAAAEASAKATRDLTDALIRRSDDESRMERNERRGESTEQWRPRGQSDNDR